MKTIHLSIPSFPYQLSSFSTTNFFPPKSKTSPFLPFAMLHSSRGRKKKKHRKTKSKSKGKGRKKMSLTIPANLPTAITKPKLNSKFSTKPRAVTISCSANQTQSSNEQNSSSISNLKALSAAVALSSILMSTPVLPASADIAGLTPCKDSKQFAKREKQEIKKLESSLKLYAPDSAPALAINATIEKTHRRFVNYGNQGLLCGSDGLPHLIVSGDQKHWGEFITPGILFLYIAGWIGWVGRSYLIAIRDDKKPTQKEIIIDVPLAVSLVGRGFSWPISAYREFVTGELIDPSV